MFFSFLVVVFFFTEIDIKTFLNHYRLNFPKAQAKMHILVAVTSDKLISYN